MGKMLCQASFCNWSPWHLRENGHRLCSTCLSFAEFLVYELNRMTSISDAFVWFGHNQSTSHFSLVQDRIHSAANILFLLVFLAFFVLWRRSCQHGRRISTFSNIVSILSAVLCLANLTAGMVLLLNDESPGYVHGFIFLTIQGLSWMMISITVRYQLVKSMEIILCCWGFLMLVCSAVSIARFLLISNGGISIQMVLTFVTLPLSLLIIICGISRVKLLPSVQNNSLREPLLNGEKAPFFNAGFFSRVFFTWMNPLLALGYKKPLEKSDVPWLVDEDKAETTSLKYLDAWESQKKERPSDPESIFQALVTCHWKNATVTGLFAFLKTLTISCNPLVLQIFINFSAGIRHFPYEGYVLVVCLLVAKVIECLSQRHWYFGTRRIGLRVRSALIAAIYQKELRLSHEARQRHSGGEIVSYISVDTYRLGEFPWWLHQIWTIPLQMSLALCILVFTVGWATLPGFCIIVLTAVIQIPLAKAQQKYQSNLMVAQDERLRLTTSILSSMKIVKLQAWEGMFKILIERSRAAEMKWLTGFKHISAFGSIMYWMSPIVTASVVFAACIPFGLPLNATAIFTVMATFRVIQEPVRNVPDVLTAIIQARVSLARLSRFFHDKELQHALDWELFKDDTGAVLIENGSFNWDSSGKPTLNNIHLIVRHGELVAICGAVGSGKSTLLYSILGEIPKLSGMLKVRGRIAYVAQTAWIQSGTVKDNILFGYTMDRSRYKETLKACALEEDLARFSHGDLTEIGERGLNLSGGQKQRIQLARALYADADIYLLDDPFSAVDAQTAANLFKAYILGALSEKTVILVTHQVEFLSSVDTILVMNTGQIAQAGRYQDLLEAGNMFEQLVNAHEDAMVQVEHSNIQKQLSGSSTRIKDSSAGESYHQLTQEEEREIGNLGLKPYKDYINTSGGGFLFLTAMLAQALFIIGNVSSNYWLATQVSNSGTSVYALIGVFSAISFVSTGFIYARSRLFVELGLRASQAFFSGLVESLFQAPMVVFDSTPLGRILSRASSDMSLLDVDLPTSLAFAVAGSFELVGMLIVIAVVTWQILFVAIPMLAILKWIQGYYLTTARELIRINGTTKAPILNKTGETVTGAVTIRAFKKEEQFKKDNLKMIDSDATVSLHTFAAYEWVAMRIEILGTIVLASAALLMVLLKNRVPPGFAGLSLSYALAVNGCQLFFVQWASNMASYIISVERIQQYMDLPKEAPAVIESNRPPSAWPTEGKVELQKLEIRYRENSPLVLKGISCIFPGGKRIGLVGRTGSGKTTLISALFRLVELAGGRVLIDGIDIATIGLFDLRSRLGVIPQEAFLFRGTVRSNLDPSEQCTDQQIWETLRKCQLSQVIEEAPNKLDTLVTDEGENWSAGQRQLFCLARVLLKCSRVLVLDEATASIDSTTDAIVQKVIREEFANCTVITVAHRIPTVIDSDMILGLKNGRMVEYDTPKALLENKNSQFAKLVAEYWSSCNQKR